MNKQPMLAPSYLSQFSCIGPDCEETCCAGWNVAIDKNTYKKYNKVHSDLKPSLDKHVKRNRNSKGIEDYAKIAMTSDDFCPLLNEEKLCSIQLKLGESYLSNVCSTYPKVSNIVNGVLEKSATLSCPEAARLALLNPNGIDFDETEELKTVRNTIKSKLETTVGNQEQLVNYFWELRIFTIQTIQNRNYGLAERLIFLGMFFQKAQQYILANELHQIPQLIASYTVLLEEQGLSDTLEKIPSLTSIQMELLKNLIDTRVSKGVRSTNYIECFGEFLTGIQYTKDATAEEISSRYQAAYEDYYTPFMKDHEYILENYLVNYVFIRLFPINNENDIFEEYIMMIINYALVKMHLIGMAGYHKENFGSEQIIKLVYSFGRTVEHSSSYLREVRELLRKNEVNSMAYMAILIKNN